MGEIEQNNDVSMANIMESFNQSSNGGEEEILRIASNYALQIGSQQIRTLLMLKMVAIEYASKNHAFATQTELFVKEYLDMKHHHESGAFIMRVIDSLAVKRLITENTAKVNVMK